MKLQGNNETIINLVESFRFSACKIIETSSKSRERLRSVLGTGSLVTAYRAALSVAAPGEHRYYVPPTHICFIAERMRIDKKKIFKISLKFFKFFIKTFLKSFKINFQNLSKL